MVEDHQHRQSVGGCRKESEVSRSGTELDDLADTKRRQKAAVVPYGVLKASWAAKTLTVALVLLFLAIAVFFWHKNRLIDEKLLQFYAANHGGRQSHPN